MSKLILTHSVRRAFTTDNAPVMPGTMTIDAATADAAGAFLMSALEAYDPQLYTPLYEYTYTRDIDLRLDVSLGQEVSSFGRVTYGGNPGTSSGSRKSFIGGKTDALPGVSSDVAKQYQPLTPWGITCQWSVFELASSALIPGASIDTQQLDAMNMKWNQDNDEMVYRGDAAIGYTGLVNNPAVAVTNAPNGAGGSPLWSLKTPAEILADINALISRVWLATGYAITPNRIGLPPAAWSYLVNNLVSTAGSRSILNYLRENNLATANSNVPIEIVPMKYLADAGVGGVGRMIAYTKRRDVVRYPQVPIQRTPLQIKGIFQSVDYYAKLGTVEFVRPEAIAYVDGITPVPT